MSPIIQERDPQAFWEKVFLTILQEPSNEWEDDLREPFMNLAISEADCALQEWLDRFGTLEQQAAWEENKARRAKGNTPDEKAM